MKLFKVPLLVIALLLASCQKEDNSEAIASLVGHWHVYKFEPNESTLNATLAADAIRILEERGCDPVEFTFGEGGWVSYTNKMPFLSVSEGENGTEVECFFNDGTREGIFDYDSETLTLDLDGETLKFRTSVENDTITLITNNLVLNGETLSGTLYFKEESGN